MSVLELHLNGWESARPVAEVLDEVRTLAPEQQFCALNPYSLYGPAYRLSPDLKAADIDAFIDFASDADERVPLLVRVQALQRITEQIIQSPEALGEYSRDLNKILPTGPAAAASSALQSRGEESRKALGVSWGLHSDLTQYLMHDAGISNKQIVFPEWDQWSFDPSCMPDFNPAMGMMYLAQMADRGAPGTLQKLAPLAAEFKNTCSRLIAGSPADELEKAMPLLGLVGYAEYGMDHMTTARELFKDAESNEIASVLGCLGREGRGLHAIFPGEYNVMDGVRELMANSLYALNEHRKRNNTTDIRLPLNNEADVLPLQLKDDEPLELLRYLSGAMRSMGQCALERNSTVVRATNEKDFAVYRMFNEGAQSSVYIRPGAGYTYRRDMEYGRPGSGVEASISFVADPTLSPGQLLEIGKHHGPGPDNRISIRLDREGHVDSSGRRDPTTKEGILSLDVGSIIGDDNWLSTKVGRLLAWGNLLRSQHVGELSGLNHVRRYFTAEDGHADFFAAAATRLTGKYEGRATPLSRLEGVIAKSGVLAVGCQGLQ